MNLNLRLFLVICILVYLGIIINLLRKKKLNLKYTLIWLFSGIIMLVVSIFPQIINFLSSIIGIVDVTNAVFILEGMFVLVILLSLTSIVSHFNDRNRELIQKVALLEKRVRELERLE
ncbi:hypothetical protein ACH52_0680 [Eubacterium limosum]|nr:hypothetical protein ACH52_0680 [Eubacterium limosum]